MTNAKPVPLNATYLRSRWCSPDGAYRISDVKPDSGGNSVTVAGPGLPPLVKGQAYRFVGAWEVHPTHGRQYRYTLAVQDVGVDREGVVAYLTRLDGIGAGRAGKLWEAYGDKAITAVRDAPASVAVAKLLPADVAFRASKSLQQDAWRERLTLEMYSMLAKRGFQVAKVVDEAVSMWGQRAAEHVKKNPYALMLKGVTSCGWIRTDALYLDMGGKRDSLKRQALSALAWMRDRPGDTWHDAESVSKAIRAACGPGVEPAKAMRLAIRGKLLVLWRSGQDRYLALGNQAKDEARVAEMVAGLMVPQTKRRTGQ